MERDSMKKIISLLALLFCASIQAQTVTGNLNITNTPVNGNSLTIGSVTFIWTNNTPSANFVLITNTLPANATNLYNVVAAVVPFNGVTVVQTNITNLVFTAIGLTASTSGTWASLTFSTNSGGGSTNVVVPISVYNIASRTNVESGLIADENAYSTNAIDQTKTIASQLVGLGNNQTVTGTKYFSATLKASALNVSNATTLDTGGAQGIFTDGNGTLTVQAQLIVDGSTSLDLGNILTDDAGDIITIRNITNAANISATKFWGNASGLTNYAVSNLIGTAAFIPSTNGTGFGLTETGTNTLNAELILSRFNNTGLANGMNQDVQLGTNCNTKLSGPTAAFTTAGFAAPNNDQFNFVQNSTSFQWTIQNQNGFEATAANRIFTGTGVDVVLSSNSWALFKYDSSVSLWILLFASGQPSSGGSGTFSGTFSGNGGGLTNLINITQTNFISGQLYTNTNTVVITVSANAVLSETGVAGAACMSLEAAGYLTNQFGETTLITSLAVSKTNYLAMEIPIGQTYVFTNRSAGSGDGASIVGGQILVH
jgi:hypothetical protein